MSSSYRKKALSIAVSGAIAGMTPAMVWAQGGNTLEEITVTGIRGTLQSAQQLKRNADSVIDAITASDIGALPDKSVTEALQRVPGITIERFDSTEDPNHPALEGAGVVVRGLKRTRSEFNGRDSYSAGNDGTGLSFQDVPPELLGSVEVSKNVTASQIAGGIAGTVNLITRKPFDSDDRLLAVSARYRYDEFGGENSPSFSGLFSDSWENDSGKFGFLVNLSDSEVASRGDSIYADNYYLRTSDQSLVAFGEPASNPLAAFPDDDLYLPNGVGILTNNNVRDRQGVATTFQWQSPDKAVLATAEYIRSDSSQSWRERALSSRTQGYNNDQRNQLVQDANGNTNAVFTNGIFQSGDVAPGFLRADTRVNDVEDLVEDASLHLTISPSSRLTVDLDVQRIESTHETYNFTLANNLSPAGTDFPTNAYFLDVTGANPTLQFLESQTVTSDNEAFINTVNGNLRDAEAESTAFAADVEYTFDDSWITSVQGGAYVSDRDLTVRDNEYANWGAVSCGWCGSGGTSLTGAISRPDLHDQVSFSDLLGGGAVLGSNNTFFFPKFELLENREALRDTFDQGLITQWGENPFDLNQRNADGFRASEIASTNEKRQEAYVQVNWALDDLEMPIRGNFGLRYVSYDVDSTGSVTYPSPRAADDPRRAFLTADQLAFMSGVGENPETVSSDYSTVLPSFNMSVSLKDDLIGRFAVSKGIYFPRPRDLRNTTTITFERTDILADPSQPASAPGNLIGVENVSFNAVAQNPSLDPEEAINYDLTLEWYFAEVGSLTASAFYKDMTNLYTQGTYVANTTNTSSGTTQVVNFRGPINGGDGSVKGIELAYTQFYDFLPGAWSGLGMQLNYTLLSQNGLGDVLSNPAQTTAITGVVGRNDFRNFTGLPLPGYSDRLYNVALIYEKHDISARLAYSWRSDYMLTNDDADQQAPVFVNSHGELDGSIFYRINDNIELGLEASNLTEEESTTRFQLDQAGNFTDRAVNAKGRAFSLVFKGNF